MIYLASPYSGTSEQQEERYLEAMKCVASFMPAPIFSPIVHCHDMAKRLQLPTDATYWEKYDRAMIHSAEAVWILCIPGWKQSVGVAEEEVYAKAILLPIRYVKLHRSEGGLDYVLEREAPD